MSTLEWWYDLDPGFLAHTALLADTFATKLDGRIVTVHPPDVPDDAVRWANEPLGPPRIPGHTPSSPPGPDWGWLGSFTAPGEEIVAVRRLVLTSEVDTAIEAVQGNADRMVKATSRWWASVSSWIEIATGQHLTHVGHHAPQVIGDPIPIWLNEADGQKSTPIKVSTGTRIELTPLHIVDQSIFRNAALLSEPGPPLSWVLLRDARSLKDAGQYRRAVIDAATASDVAVTQLLDTELQAKNPTNRTQIMTKNPMFGQKLTQLANLGLPLSQSFRDNLVAKRNMAVHEGAVIGKQECSDAINEAVSVVERAFPHPTPTGSATPLVRLW